MNAKHKKYTEEERQAFTRTNQHAWNTVAPIHAQANQRRLLAEISDPEFKTLAPHCLDRLLEIGVEGKSVAQVCCNNGRELLALKSLGAGPCIGFDFSEKFISQARELLTASGHQDVAFVATDIHLIPAEHLGPHDIVFSTVGVIGWMPDIEKLFDVYSALTRTGGYLFMEDIHPVLLMYDETGDDGPSTLQYSYFRSDPWIEADNLDYYEGSDYDAPPTCFFQHTLSDILNAGIGSGFVLKRIDELDFDISTVCPDLEFAEAKPPMGLTMVWRKTGDT